MDVKQRELEKLANDILSTSPVGQAPPVYHQTLEKIIELTKRKAKIWNQIRNYIIPGTQKTLWQIVLDKLPVVRSGQEKYLDFYGQDIRRQINNWAKGGKK